MAGGSPAAGYVLALAKKSIISVKANLLYPFAPSLSCRALFLFQ
jgi:hypothetical protein